MPKNRNHSTHINSESMPPSSSNKEQSPMKNDGRDALNELHIQRAYMTNFRLQNLLIERIRPLIGKEQPQLLLEAIALANEIGRCLGSLKDPNGSALFDKR